MPKKPTYKDLAQRVKELELGIERCRDRGDWFGKEKTIINNFLDNANEFMGIFEVLDDELDLRYIKLNKSAQNYLGKSSEALHGMLASQLGVTEEVRRIWIDECRKCALTGISEQFEYKRQLSDGIHTLLATASEIKSPYFSFVIFDITERKQAEEDLRQNRAMLEAALTSMADAVVISDDKGRFIHFNDASVKFHRFRSKDECPKRLSDYPNILEIFLPNGKLANLDQWPAARALRGETTTNAEYTLRRKDTGENWIGSYNFSPIRGDDGEITGAVVVGRDITIMKQAEEALRRNHHSLELRVQERTIELSSMNAALKAEIDSRKRIETSLRESEEKYRRIFDNELMAICIFDLETFRIIDINEAHTKIYGYSRDELVGGMKAYDLSAEPETSKALMERRKSLGTTYYIPLRHHKKKDGTVFPVEIVSGPYTLKGRQVMFIMARDISERKRAENERERLFEQLAQSQKMESVGRLAGGVAHDFNNMLGVILGHAELALEQVKAGSPVHDDLKEIRKAAQRSADLTRQLLAFARRQTSSPKVLDVNETIANMLTMIRRLIGEDIQLAWVPGANLWPVKIDPAQIDQILANLCVNARDAIKEGGRITIETQNVVLDKEYCNSHGECRPGNYVMLAVSDDGSGMEKETLANLFEPFFTTKDVGEGTGLGLSTVYGIIKQNAGHIEVFSEVEQGSTFKIYFHRTRESIEEKAAPPTKKRYAGNETLLLVEDEASILNLAKVVLEQLGYTVLFAGTPKAALAIAQNHKGKIHLLITDVVMPEMNGRQLKERIERLIPDIKVLFMSGYTSNIVSDQGVIEKKFPFLQKPFSTESLAERVRDVLDREYDSSAG